MASIPVIPILIAAFSLIIILALVSLACGITLLITKNSCKRTSHPKALAPISWFLIGNGTFLFLSVVIFCSKIITTVVSWIGGK